MTPEQSQPVFDQISLESVMPPLPQNVGSPVFRDTEAECWMGYELLQKYKKSSMDEHEAFEHFQKAARKGHTEAIYEVGKMYEHGIGVVESQYQAYEHIRQSAEKGLPDAMLDLGLMLCYGRGTELDDTAGVKWIEQAAEKGQAYALYMMGVLHFNGYPYPQDFAAALPWFEKAAQKQVPAALCALGLSYWKGTGMEMDESKAFDLLQQAAEHGYPEAQYQLYHFLIESSLGKPNADFGSGSADDEEDPTPEEQDFRDWEDDEASWLEAESTMSSEDDPGDDVFNAVKWLRKAAENDHKEAQLRLGLLLVRQAEQMEEDNRLRDERLSDAYEWVQASADQNHPEALWILAKKFSLNRSGSEVTLEYMAKAAKAGHEEALRHFMAEYCNPKGFITASLPEKKRILFFAKYGHPEAMFDLGHSLYLGLDNYPVDEDQAIKWFKAAAEQGHEEAQKRVRAFLR